MSEILTPEEYEREWWDILETRQAGYESYYDVNPETRATLKAHDAALRSRLADAESLAADRMGRVVAAESELARELARRVAAEREVARWQRIRTPTHGECCTCQACGLHHDECRCCLDDVADELSALKESLKTAEAERDRLRERVAELEEDLIDIPDVAR